MTDRAMADRLILQIERGVVIQAQLRVLLTDADVSLAGHRTDLRKLKARLARKSPPSRRNK